MKKIFTLLILLISLCMPAFSQNLKGEVEYTVDNARIVAFDNSPIKIHPNEFKGYLRDPFLFKSLLMVN